MASCSALSGKLSAHEHSTGRRLFSAMNFPRERSRFRTDPRTARRDIGGMTLGVGFKEAYRVLGIQNPTRAFELLPS